MFIVNFVVKDLNGGIDKMTIEEAIIMTKTIAQIVDKELIGIVRKTYVDKKSTSI